MNIQQKLQRAITLMQDVAEEINLEEGTQELIDHPLAKWIKNDDGLHKQYVKVSPLSYDECEKLCRDYHKEDVKKVLIAILGWKKFPRDVNSLYLTARNWLNRRDADKNNESGTSTNIQVA